MGKLVKCLVCGEIFDADKNVCPVCGAGPESFVPYEPDEKEGIRNTEEIFLILGNGAAGVNAAEEIRKRNETCSIVMVSSEEVPGYNRPMLTKTLSRPIDVNLLLIHDANWYENNRIINLLGKSAQKIDIKNREVQMSDGTRFRYDKCIYALGASCFVPPFPGADLDGVIAIRNLKDVKRVQDLLADVTDVVVIGGGVLGLEAAWELKKAGRNVTVLEQEPHIMNRQLDETSSLILEELVKKAGIGLMTSAATELINGDGKVGGVTLKGGQYLPAQMVIVSCGIRANTQVAADAGIEIKRAVVVNDKMETSVPGIYACGDCAELGGINYGIWPQAVNMGKTAGANAAGASLHYQPEEPMLTFLGMDTKLFAMGDIGKNPGLTYRIEEKKDEAGTYEKYFYVEDQLVGAVLIGDLSKMRMIMDKIKCSHKI
ncbi:FAD-dependent oxidoreductase [Anaerolentibacter hominis]|uniref:FAD-dependent oxidoreductase n=1 Tax=Anaerolentibacter hominis TaxID=3079009 RepID=UPI0031B88C27